MSKHLDGQTCIPCQGGVAALDREAAEALLKQVPGWELNEDASRIRRTATFADFVGAQNFAVAVGELAEAQNHHPDICYGWGYCTVTFFTHKIGGLHKNDFIMAARVNRL